MSSFAVMEAIACLLADLWPERIIYRDFCPYDFERPSFFLWTTKEQREVRSLHLVEVNASFMLEIFCATDEYDVSSTEELRLVQADVLELLAGPKIKVSDSDTGEDRYITITAMAAGQEPGSAFVQIQANWMDSKAASPEPVETIEHVAIRHEV
jgi:hypothetical protein